MAPVAAMPQVTLRERKLAKRAAFERAARAAGAADGDFGRLHGTKIPRLKQVVSAGLTFLTGADIAARGRQADGVWRARRDWLPAGAEEGEKSSEPPLNEAEKEELRQLLREAAQRGSKPTWQDWSQQTQQPFSRFSNGPWLISAAISAGLVVKSEPSDKAKQNRRCGSSARVVQRAEEAAAGGLQAALLVQHGAHDARGAGRRGHGRAAPRGGA